MIAAVFNISVLQTKCEVVSDLFSEVRPPISRRPRRSLAVRPIGAQAAKALRVAAVMRSFLKYFGFARQNARQSRARNIYIGGVGSDLFSEV